MPKDSRERRPLSNGHLLSPAPILSPPPPSLRSPDTGSKSQHLIIQRPRRSRQRQDPYHNPNADKDVARRIHVLSHRDKGVTEIDAIFAHDLDGQCWISEETVERLNLKRKKESGDEYGVLARRTFIFCGVVTLEWLDGGRARPMTCSVVPKGVGIGFEVFFQSSILPPTSPQERTMSTPRVLSNYMPPSVEDCPVSKPSTDYIGSFDGEGLDGFAEFMEDNLSEAKSADKWMYDLKLKVHGRKRPTFVRDKDSPPVKIAVLDTGIDLQHNYIKGCKNANRIKGLRSFVSNDERTNDVCGHGTHVAALLLKVAPECQIYVAKVASGTKIPTDHSIADALEWAINQEVDIISMSFGMDADHPGMQKQIMKAYERNIIMFAAASNRGHNYQVTFPARENEVICVYSTDGLGGKSHCNPAYLKTAGYHFATVGVAVKSSWPVNLPLPPNASSPSERSMAGAAQQFSELPQPATPKVDKTPERRMTGTSFATPIVAAIAAYILDFARINGIGEDLYQRLRCRKWMQEIFAEHMTSENEKLHYIHPWKLFADHRTDEGIMALIKDTLTQGISGSQQGGAFED